MGWIENLREVKRFFPILGWDAVKYQFGIALEGVIRVKRKGTGKNINLRKNGSDRAVFRQVFLRKDYLFKLPQEPAVILDLGANIGLTSLFLADRYPKARIISVEPEEGNYAMLVGNIRTYPQITPVNKGIWNRTCRVEIIDREVPNWGFMVRETDSDAGIPAVSVLDLMNLYGLTSIDLLKMDIEGSEKEVFEGDAAAWLGQVRVLVIELHDRWKPGCSKAVFKCLEKFNYEMAIQGDNLIFYFH